MQPSSYSDIIRRLLELGSFEDDATAADVLNATLRALGSVLRSDERESLCRALPPELASSVGEPSQGGRRSVREFFLDVSLHAGVRVGLAIRYAAIVCRVLGEILTPRARMRLAHALPELGELLQPPVEATRALASVTSERQAGARDTDQPYSETKRLTACGLAEEREARSLSQLSHRPAGGGH